MALTPVQQPTGKSLDEIAAIMAANREKMMKNPPKQPNEVEEEDEIIEEEQEEENDLEDEENGEEELEGEEQEEEDEPQLSAEDDEGAGSEEDDDDADLEIDDDTLFEIEGLDDPVSFAELKEIYTSDKTIKAKLDEIKADHEAIQTTRNTTMHETEILRQAMQQVIENIEQVLVQPLVGMPNVALKQSNPSQYIAQQEAYQRDQERIANSRNLVLGAMQEFQKQYKENEDNRRAYEIGRLSEKLPDLRVEGKKQGVMKDIVDAADAYGFSPEELNRGSDHRLFFMAYEAMQYRKLKNGMRLNNQEEREEKARTKIRSGPKVMRSRGTSARKSASASAKRVKVVKNRAQTTGKPEDVANFMTTRRNAALT